ncbi:MAG: hypothetical protein ACYC91_15365 [Solirubrobacteraceae bacterium]
MSGSPSPLFGFAQFEFPWLLGPPDGRYLLRREGDPPDSPPAHVLVMATLGAPERRRLARSRKHRAEPEPEPSPVATARTTVIDVAAPWADADGAAQWLKDGGEPDLERPLTVLNRALHAFRLVTADPFLNTVSREQALVARIGYGAGEEVADGRWSAARELRLGAPRTRRTKVLHPQARLAAVLGGRERAMACEELTLRARLDVEQGRAREAALQVLVALDAAIAELGVDPTARELSGRLDELRDQRDAVAEAAQTALAGPLDVASLAVVSFTLGRVEAALRARAVANA